MPRPKKFIIKKNNFSFKAQCKDADGDLKAEGDHPPTRLMNANSVSANRECIRGKYPLLSCLSANKASTQLMNRHYLE